MYSRCPKPATQRMQGEYGVPWFGCDKHAPAMAAALGKGQRVDYHVEVTPLR